MDVNNIEKKVWAYIKDNNMLEDCSNAVVGRSRFCLSYAYA